MEKTGLKKKYALQKLKLIIQLSQIEITFVCPTKNSI